MEIFKIDKCHCDKQCCQNEQVNLHVRTHLILRDGDEIHNNSKDGENQGNKKTNNEF